RFQFFHFERRENITQQQSLSIIESMINKAKNQFSENGFIYLLWGWIILVCSSGQFFLQHILHYPKYYLVWTLTWVAVAIQIFYYSRKEKRKMVKTYTDEITGYVWLSFVIMMVLCGSLFNRMLKPDQEYMGTVIILVLYGMPTFLSGIILKFKPLIGGGLCCWSLSVLSLWLPHDITVLLLSIAVIAAWIIPGYLLRSRFIKQNAQ
ncbi:MAG: hypothetical protein ABJB86_11045, partial [Bacteroidota bacterium]